VIGIDGYDGKNWPQLSNGIRDAEEVAKGLTAQGFVVTLKKNLKSGELEDALKYFFHHEGNDPDTRLLLWFAGHGHTLDGEGYIIPADAPSPKDVADFRDKAISLRRFGEYMREANAKHVLAIFDSCFSGSVFNVARSFPPPAITLATTQPVREFISSGEAEQTVSDDGTFRKLFLDVLAGKEPDADANHDGYVTGTELGLFLHQKMTNFTNNRQTPRYGKLNAYGYDRGDFVFQVGKPDVPATAAAPTPQPTNDAAQAWAAGARHDQPNGAGGFHQALRRQLLWHVGACASGGIEEEPSCCCSADAGHRAERGSCLLLRRRAASAERRLWKSASAGSGRSASCSSNRCVTRPLWHCPCNRVFDVTFCTAIIGSRRMWAQAKGRVQGMRGVS
jgi:hypothetical protein